MARVADSNIPPEAIDFGDIFHLTTPNQVSPVLIVCEHASNRIPAGLNQLGLPSQVTQSHVAWDPGALGVAQALARIVPAPLLSGNVSRLVYDCNRPPEAASAVPERSEVYDITGNKGLSPADRARRVQGVYQPFCQALSGVIAGQGDTLRLMVTVHSFTPVFNGTPRAVELGLVHGRDDRFTRSMMQNLPADWPADWPADRPAKGPYDIRLNEPYGAADGVAHTLDAHGAANGLLSVMIEIRNDLIGSRAAQQSMAAFLAPWILRTLDGFTDKGAAA